MKKLLILNIYEEAIGEIEVYELDSSKTVSERIASLFSITPKFLYFPKEFSFKDDQIAVLNLSDLVKSSENFGAIIDILFRNNFFETEHIMTFKDLVEYYVYNNEELEKQNKLEQSQREESFYFKNMYIDHVFATIYCEIFISLLFLESENVLPENYRDGLAELKQNIQAYLKKDNIDFKDLESSENLKMLCEPFSNNGGRNERFFSNMYISLERIWEEKDSYLNILDSKILENSEISEKTSKSFREFDEYEGLSYSDFELEQVDYTLKFVIENKTSISVLELFNYLTLTNNVPFATSNNYFKVLKEFIPLESWSEYAEVLGDSILLKINNKKDLYQNINNADEKILDENYSNILFSIEKDENENDYIKADFSLINKPKYVLKEIFIERMMECLNSDLAIQIIDEQINNINGFFVFPKIYLNNIYVINDFIINDERFSSVLTINEKKATKDKASLHVRFFHESSDKLTADLTDQIVDKEIEIPNCLSQKTENQSIKNLPNGSKYLRVKIRKSSGPESISFFQTILSKLLRIYEIEYQSISDIYSEFIPEFSTFKTIDETKKQKSGTKKLQLKDVLPDVFLPKYSKRCDPVRQPKIVNIEDLPEGENENVLLFPKKEKEDDLQCAFMCKNVNFPYPGLLNNKLSNNDKYPFLPCCYEAPQNKPGSRYRQYYFGEEKKEDKKSPVLGVIITNKLVFNGTRAKLPVNINKIFQLNINNILRYNYLRRGVLNTKHSFLNCVLEAMNPDIDGKNFRNLSSEKKIEVMVRIREELSTESWPISCKQEMYDYGKEDIERKIKNIELYFDPRLFIHLLEIKYQCNIYMFTRNKNHPNGAMILPRFNKTYYKMSNDKKTVLIYEHMGSDLDKKEFPHCELIVQENKKDPEDMVRKFDYNSEVSRIVKHFFQKMCESYNIKLGEEKKRNNIVIKNVDYKFLTFEETEEIKFLSQVIDSYGKTRMINIEFIEGGETNIVSLLTDPIQPLNLPEYNSQIVNQIRVNNAESLIKKLNVKVICQVSELSRDQGIINEINGKIGDVNIVIPLKNSKPIKNIPIVSKNINYLKYNISLNDMYNKCKKNAKYISQYIFWLYSEFLENNNIKMLKDMTSETNILKFFDEYTTLIENYQYGYVSRYFSKDNSLFQDGKLVIENLNTKNKFIYVLVLKIVRDENGVQEYYKKQILDDFFEEETDFDYHDYQIILKGTDLLNQRNINITNKLNIYESYHLPENNQSEDQDNLYFFQNKIIDDNVYLAQNTDDIYKALKIAYIWNSQNYNCGYEASNIESDISDDEIYSYSYTLYTLSDSKNITKYIGMGMENDFNIKILGYKVDEKNLFTVLLR